jgi:DNA-binding MarR family transcriptional regulator
MSEGDGGSQPAEGRSFDDEGRSRHEESRSHHAEARSHHAAALLQAVDESLESLLRHVAGRNAPEFLGVDVTMSQAKVMHVARLRPGISMSALAAELKVGPSAISGLVDRLVEHGYLERQEDPSDRRQQLVSLTPAGQEMVDRIREFSVSHVRPLLARLSGPELAALHTGITALDREALAASGALPDAAVHERTSP